MTNLFDGAVLVLARDYPDTWIVAMANMDESELSGRGATIADALRALACEIEARELTAGGNSGRLKK